MGQRDRFATTTNAGRDAQALVEQRLSELRALAASDDATISGPGGITATSRSTTAVTPIAPSEVREIELDPIPSVQFDTAPATPATAATGGATLRVVHSTPAVPVDAAVAATPIDSIAPATTSGASAAELSVTIEAAIDRVEHALQRDAAQIASTLQTWGSPARAAGDLGDQLAAALQRMEHALRADLARVAQSAAIAAEGTKAPAQVIEAVAQWTQRADASLEQRLGGVHAQLLQFDARLRDLVAPVQDVAAGSAIAADLVPTLGALQTSIVELGNGIEGVQGGVDAGMRELATELSSIDATLVDRILGDGDGDAKPLDAQLLHAVASVDASLTAAVAQVDARVEEVIAAATAAAAAGIAAHVDASAAGVAQHVDSSAAGIAQHVDSSAAALAQHVDIQVENLAGQLASLDANTSADGTVVAGFRWQLDALRTSVDARFDQLTDLVASAAAQAVVARPQVESEAVDEIRASLRQIELRTAPVNDRLHDLADLLRSVDRTAGDDATSLHAAIERIATTLEDTTRIEGIAASVQHLDGRIDDGLHGLIGEQLQAAIETLQARIVNEGEGTRGEVQAMVGELAAVLEQARASQTEAVSTERLSGLLATALQSHHADLASDLQQLEETLLATQDDVPEELSARVTGAIDALQAQLAQQSDAWQASSTAERSHVTESLAAMQQALGSDLVEARTALTDDMAELQRRMISELDYNRLQHVRDVETVIEAMTSGWTAMFQRLQVGDERIARLERRLETWIDAIDATGDELQSD